MNQVIEKLADLTRSRDRDVVDVTLTTLVRDLIDPLTVSIHRRVRVDGEDRWLCRARHERGALVAGIANTLDDLSQLPALGTHPDRERCLREQALVEVAGPTFTTCIPLATDTGPFGVLEVESDTPIAQPGQALLVSVAKVYRNLLSLLDYSERDTLTGLLNRRTFDDAFLRDPSALPDARDGSQFTASQTGIWLAVIDVDHFKQVNDRHGHLIGDEVLLLLARLLQANFRMNDRLFRFGGEEFVVLMRCPGETEALIACERLRQSVADCAFPQVGQVTISIGVGPVRADDPPARAFERGDRAVYRAKQEGRNRVVSWSTLPEARTEAEAATTSGDVELF
ncbi:MAG TPA: GGDEF domain-containing protein [Gammaproteobacteria bacterium]|nr:GGDEF domain-containing protein [Gammaproteobacteria bacterium]